MKTIIIAVLLCLPLMVYATKDWEQRADKLVQELPNHGEDTIKVKLLQKISKVYLKHKPKEALNYAQQALTLCGQLSYKRGMAPAYTAMGLAYERMGKDEDALNNYKAAMALDKELNDQHRIGGSLCDMANVYIAEKNYDKALALLTAAKQTFESIPGARDSDEYYGNTLMALALVYAKDQKLASADRACEDAYKIFENVGAKDKLAATCVILSAIRTVQENYPEAKTYANKALALGMEDDNAKIIDKANKCLERIQQKEN